MRPQLKLRPIGIRDYSVREGSQRIGRIRFATERMPCIWIWNVRSTSRRSADGIGQGSRHGKAEFKAAWEALKARTTPEQLAAAYKAMNIGTTTDPRYLRMRRAMLSVRSGTCSRLLTSLATEWRDKSGRSFQMSSASLCH